MWAVRIMIANSLSLVCYSAGATYHESAVQIAREAYLAGRLSIHGTGEVATLYICDLDGCPNIYDLTHEDVRAIFTPSPSSSPA